MGLIANNFLDFKFHRISGIVMGFENKWQALCAHVSHYAMNTRTNTHTHTHTLTHTHTHTHTNTHTHTHTHTLIQTH